MCGETARMPTPSHGDGYVMQIQLNGEPRELASETSILQLLEQLDLVGRRVAVELNLDIVPRSAHATTILQPGDRVEVVHAIGGG